VKTTIETAHQYAVIIRERVFQKCPEMTALVRHAIPSITDITAEFRAHLHRVAPHIDCAPAPTARILVLEVDGKLVEYRRRRSYVRMLIDGHELRGGGQRVDDAVRGAYLGGARKYADMIAEEAAAAGLTQLLPMGNVLRHPGIGNGEPWVAVDPDLDGMLAMMAGYYYLTPAGTVVSGDASP
jgi:hypothetical protein